MIVTKVPESAKDEGKLTYINYKQVIWHEAFLHILDKLAELWHWNIVMNAMTRSFGGYFLSFSSYLLTTKNYKSNKQVLLIVHTM